MKLTAAQTYLLKLALTICSKVLQEIKQKNLKPKEVADMQHLEGCVQTLECLTLG